MIASRRPSTAWRRRFLRQSIKCRNESRMQTSSSTLQRSNYFGTIMKMDEINLRRKVLPESRKSFKLLKPKLNNEKCSESCCSFFVILKPNLMKTFRNLFRRFCYNTFTFCFMRRRKDCSRHLDVACAPHSQDSQYANKYAVMWR